MMFWSSISNNNLMLSFIDKSIDHIIVLLEKGLITGWITVRFGFCDLIAEVPTKPDFNYAGIALILFSTIAYLFVKAEANINKETNHLTNPTYNYSIQDFNENAVLKGTFYDRVNNSKLRYPIGIGLSVFAGIFYGQTNTPIVYVRNNYANASQNNLDYMFSYTTGILLTSIFYFTVYCMIKKNKPTLYPEVILPGFGQYFYIYYLYRISSERRFLI